MNAKRNAKGAITAITHQNATGEMTMQYRDDIITALRTVDKGVMYVEENESWEMIRILAIPLVRYMGKGTEILQKIRVEFEVDNKGIAITTQIRWLANRHTIREMRQNRVIVASSVVFVVKGNNVAKSLLNKGIKAVGV
jgi:hypothetical protein